MELKEAIEIIKIVHDNFVFPADYYIAFEKAIEALEKQVAKKPKKDTGGFKICPNCQSYYIFGDDDIMYDYCPDCGQKLKWGEENDE